MFFEQKKYQNVAACTSTMSSGLFTDMTADTEQETEEYISDAESTASDFCVLADEEQADEEQSDETERDGNLYEENIDLESEDVPASSSSKLIYPNARISNAVSMLLI